MKTLALFNNKGGVGKTTLTYHLSYMLARMGLRVLTADMDPQANLTSAFLPEADLEALWDGDKNTVAAAVEPIRQGTGDFDAIRPLQIDPNLFLLPGDLALSQFEDRLSESWSKGFASDPAALRVTTAFHRLFQSTGSQVQADIILLDVGPNLGAINRSTLLSADLLLIPLAADLFSLQGLRNLGPTVSRWRQQWQRILEDRPSLPQIQLPAGQMAPIGYVVLQHAVRLDRPVQAYGRWLNRMPAEYHKSVLGEVGPVAFGSSASDTACLATLRNYRSLMPMSQDARKPMFDLRAADGAIGSHASLVQTCYQEFASLARKIVLHSGS